MQHKILIVDGRLMVAEAIAALLGDYEVATAGNKAEALHVLSEKKFDFVLVNIHINPNENGLSLIKRILFHRAKPIMLNHGVNIGQVRASILLGAYGYVNQELSSSHLYKVLHDVIDEKFSFPKGVLDELRQNKQLAMPHLARSEKRLLDYFLMHPEQTNFEISDKMALSEGRIRNCMTILMRKFDVKGRANLAKEAQFRGYYPDEDIVNSIT